MLSKEHLDRLWSLHELARAYQADGRVKKAVEPLEHGVVIQAMLVEGHPDRLWPLHQLVRAHESGGQEKQAVQLLEHVVVIRGMKSVGRNSWTQSMGRNPWDEIKALKLSRLAILGIQEPG